MQISAVFTLFVNSRKLFGRSTTHLSTKNQRTDIGEALKDLVFNVSVERFFTQADLWMLLQNRIGKNVSQADWMYDLQRDAASSAAMR